MKARPLIKAPAAEGDVVRRRVDLEDDGLAAPAQQRQRAAAAGMAAQVRQDEEVLNVDKRLRLPAEHRADGRAAVIDEIEPVCRVRHDGALRGGLALLVRREAHGVALHGRRKARIVRARKTLKMHMDSSLCVC